MTHLFLLSLIPAISAWYTATVTGWSLGINDVTYLSTASATIMAGSMSLASIAIVVIFSLFVQWMADNFGTTATFRQALDSQIPLPQNVDEYLVSSLLIDFDTQDYRTQQA